MSGWFGGSCRVSFKICLGVSFSLCLGFLLRLLGSFRFIQGFIKVFVGGLGLFRFGLVLL